eukprot:TRINITY_DN25240_c0_g1_i2.p1 TRINITY_DN25240_c0_g1~~TRINITY_DN25240_c0_g1_i2.p1  ORF type:complete len:189 (+),score=44.58 TRINITY_DN25240_c0_g1_i2:23-568(+)
MAIMHYLCEGAAGTGEGGLPGNLAGSVIVDVSPCRVRPPAMPDLRSELQHLLDLPLDRTPSLRAAHQSLQGLIPDPDQRGFLLTNLDTTTSPPHWQTDLRRIKENLPRLNWSLPESVTYESSERSLPPVRFVFGGLSPYVEEIPAVGCVFPGAEVRVIEGGGHWVHVQKKEKFLEIIKEWI